MENIFKTAADGIIVADANGFITLNNEAVDTMLGYSRGELTGKHTRELIPKVEQDEVKREDLIKELKEKGVAIGKERSWIKKDGSTIDIEENISLLRDNQGNISASIASIRDVTERKKLENTLVKRNSELYILNTIGVILNSSIHLNAILTKVFHTILEVTSSDLDCGVILLQEGDKLIIKCAIGFKSEPLKKANHLPLGVGVSSKAFHSKEPVVIESIEHYNEPQAEVLRKEGIKSFISIPISSRDKVYGTINIASHVHHHFTPEEINLLCSIGNQISLAIENIKLFEETKKALDELKNAQAYLLQSEKMAAIGQLAAGVAHEINNPTGFVHSNLGSLNKYTDKILELLKKYEELITTLRNNGNETLTSLCQELEELKKKLKIDFIMKDFKKVIADSREGTERIKKIVADLKSFSRVDQAEFKYANINEGLESTLNVVWNELKYKCTVEKNLGELPQLYCNLGQLNQVFMNLLVNAAQAIAEKGTITIATRYLNGQDAASLENSTNGSIEIKISDTGCGIPEDKIKRIFEPFFTTKAVGSGTGLGLSIAYDIIKKHHGEITVTSGVGKGTAFSITLPVLRDKE
jgi:PAS domain S-box-containing protein